MYLQCSPFLEKERDGWRPIAPMCPFVAFFILPWLAGKCPFVTMHCTTCSRVYVESEGAMRMPCVRASNRASSWYVCRLSPTTLQGQPESRPDPGAGPKGILMLAYRDIKWGLISKLLMRAFSWHPWIPRTLKLDSIPSLIKCATWLLAKRDEHRNVGDQFHHFPVCPGSLCWSRQAATLGPSKCFQLLYYRGGRGRGPHESPKKGFTATII